MKSLKLSILIMLMLAMFSVPIFANNISDYSDGDTNILAEKTIELSDYKEEHCFTDRSEIETIAKEYDLDDPKNIDEIIYVPIENVGEGNVDLEANEYITPCEIGKQEFYIKKKGNYEQKGSLIQSSTFEYPGGTMKVGKKLSRQFSFSAEAGMKVGLEVVETKATAAFGFSVTGSDYVENTQKITVARGCKRNVKAYRNLMVYNFELWEDDPIYDDFYGSGSVKRPIGVIFAIGANVKK